MFMLINCTNELPWMLYFYFKLVLQIAAHCQKNLDLAVAAKESGEIVNYHGGRGFLYLFRLQLFNVG